VKLWLNGDAMKNNVASLLLKLEEVLKNFSRDFSGLDAVYLLDEQGFTVVNLGERNDEDVLYNLINLLKENFPELVLLEIEDAATRLCLARIPDTGYFIAVYASKTIAAGLVRIKIKYLSRELKYYLDTLDKSIEEEEKEEVNIEDLKRLLEFLSKR